VRLVVEELESRNLMSAGGAFPQLLFDVPSVAEQSTISDEKSTTPPVAASAPAATTISSPDTTDWQRMVESSWGSATEHSISSELARTVHYAKADVMDGALFDTDTVMDYSTLPPVEAPAESGAIVMDASDSVAAGAAEAE
jgi:hypothetical protein